MKNFHNVICILEDEYNVTMEEAGAERPIKRLCRSIGETYQQGRRGRQI